MFAEELTGSATRKRQDEARARRRQLLKEKQKKEAAAKNATDDVAASTASVSTAAATTTAATVISGATVDVTLSSPLLDNSPPTTEFSGKSAAVANAARQRQLRQTNQLQTKSSQKIQSFYRAYRSNRDLLNHYSRLLTKTCQDLGKLKSLLNKKNPDSPFVPPPATTTALVRQLFFLTHRIPYHRKITTTTAAAAAVACNNTKSDDIQLRNHRGLYSNVQQILELCVIPGLQSQDDNMNPLLPWLEESTQGTYRLKRFMRICLKVATTPNAVVSCVSAVGQFLSLTLNLNQQHPLTSTAKSIIVPRCQSWLLVDASKLTPTDIDKQTSEEMTMDLFQTLRHLLLFTIGGAQPIPPTSITLRERCISANERAHADVFFQLVVQCVTQTNVHTDQRRQLEARFVAEILSVPLLTWKLSSQSIAKLLSTTILPGHSTLARSSSGQIILLVSMVASFIELNKQSLSEVDIGLLLPVVDLPMTQCPATNTQVLLANLVALGRVCPALNGSDRSKVDFLSAATFYQFLATLLDVVPLGTYLSRDSAVEWVTDGKGHHTAVVLSPVILDQCKVLLVESFVRNLFGCAIDSGLLKTESILASKNEKDKKHEADLRETAGATAASMAAQEARVERKRWLTSKWAGKLKKGMTEILTSSKADPREKTNYGEVGNGMLIETSSMSKQLASGATVVKQASTESPCRENSAKAGAPYSPVLLFALTRAYTTVLARWGGGGKDDIVSRSESRKNDIATSRPDPRALALLNVLCFSTEVVRTSWGLIQGDKDLASELSANVIDRSRSSIRSLAVRPSFTTYKDGRMENDAAVLLYMFVATLSHTLIITDDAEIYEFDKPLPIHQLRRCIQLLKKFLCRACNVGGGALVDKTTNPFGLSLVSSSAKVMRDLYDRSSRKPLCVPKLWLVEDLMVKEIGACKTHADYVALLSKPVLRVCPFLVAFKRRLKLFERIVTTSRIEEQGENSPNPFHSNPLKPGIPVQIMRGRVLEDGLATLNKLGPNLRHRINVQYLNEAGARESGIDAGGLFKEFWTDLCAIAFNPNYALFRVTDDDQNCMYPNPSSGAAHGRDTHIILFEFLGRILGKAMYEGITISPQFSHFFLSFLRGDYNYLHMLPDLSSVDAQLYNNLMFLKTFDGDAEDLCLTFSISNDDFGGNREIDLIPNGSNVEVTNSNKLRYIGK